MRGVPGSLRILLEKIGYGLAWFGTEPLVQHREFRRPIKSK
jgi:hypothetical protein